MKAAQLNKPGSVETGPLQIVDLPDPAPASGEIVIEVSACGVCRTDLQIVEGDIAASLPVIPGHQAVGRVVAIGPGVDGWSVGDRAGVGWLAATCGVCRFCSSGQENLCEQASFTGWDRDGGYSTHLVARSDFVLPLSDGGVDFEVAPLLCGGIIGYRALKVSGIRPGQRLGLFGFGASALLALQVANHWGCETFVVTRSESEQVRALQMGATWAGSYGQPVPGLLDAAVTFAPVGEVVVTALKALDRGGTIAINAIHLDEIPSFDYDLLWWERGLRSVSNFSRADAAEFLRLAAEIPVRTVVDPYPLGRANQALAAVKSGSVNGAAVLTI